MLTQWALLIYGGQFIGNILKSIFLIENYGILLQMSLNLIPNYAIDNKTTLVQLMP